MAGSTLHPDAETVIRVEGVWKIFGERAKEAVDAIRSEGLSKHEVLARFNCVVGVADVSFSVRRGEIFCIMGLSGSGKSTLVRHINRLIQPTAGSITLLGRDLLSLSEREVRELRAKRIGMVFQHMALMPHRSVRDNVTFPLEVQRKTKIERWETSQHTLSLVNLEGYEDHMPAQLSGGMKQRVGIARALASSPDILLMDEPFSALDPLIRRQLQTQFLDLSRQLNQTTIFITHDLDEAIRLGDRIAIMNDGRIVQSGRRKISCRNRPMTTLPISSRILQRLASSAHTRSWSHWKPSRVREAPTGKGCRVSAMIATSTASSK